LPGWHGTPGEWERFAAKTRDSIGGEEGLKMYYAIGSDISNYYRSTFFKANGPVSWADIRKGFQIWVRQYGANVYDMNEFGALAQTASDPQAACKTFSYLTSEDYEPIIWKNKEGFENRRKLANLMCMMPRSDNMEK
jgi:hypothetical protein